MTVHLTTLSVYSVEHSQRSEHALVQAAAREYAFPALHATDTKNSVAGGRQLRAAAMLGTVQTIRICYFLAGQKRGTMLRSWDERRARKAQLLLRPAITAGMGGQWADIGCGDGIFTHLLLAWLAPDSSVLAVDRDTNALRRLERGLTAEERRAVQTLQADFTAPLPSHTASQRFDGLLLANSLHFVRDQRAVLTNLVMQLRPGGHLIIVEYNAARGNWAVPHPFRDDTCLHLMTAAGLTDAQIITREPSSFLGEIYTARATK